MSRSREEGEDTEPPLPQLDQNGEDRRDHNREERICQSKTINLERREDLYLSYKDHNKKVEGKTRQIATECTSNTLALSNSVPILIESLANSEESNFN